MRKRTRRIEAEREDAVTGRRNYRRITAATAVVLAAAGAASAVPSTALADSAPPAPTPGISVGDATVSLYGAPADLDVTVTDPPATDAYMQVGFALNQREHVHLTDDAGNVVPIDPMTGVAFVGKADSNGNGIPGAPWQAGVQHLHLSIDGPVSQDFSVSAALFNGADGTVIAHTKLGENGEIYVFEPHLSADWQVPDGAHGPDGSPAVPTGDTRPTTALVETWDGDLVPGGARTRVTIPAGAIAAAGYAPEQLAAHLHLSYSADGSTYQAQTWIPGPDGSLSVQFPARQLPAGASSQEQLRFTADWGLHPGTLTVRMETLDNDGRLYAAIDSGLALTANAVPAAQRAAFYGRDATGVLWQYQASPDPAAAPGRYMSRDRVGGGWNTYNAITPLSSLTSAGTGDLVARDTDGVLWYYRGTGSQRAPFAPRTRIGAGWNTYDLLTGAGDVTGDGRPDLLARDHDGVLWLYKGTGSTTAPFAVRTRIGAGWNTYTQITGVGDMTGDGHPDLLAVDHNGVLWLYQGTGNATAPYRPPVQAGTNWGIYDRIVGVGDMTADGHPDLLARDTTGHLWYYRGTGNPTTPYAPRVQNGTNWGIYTALF